MTWLKYILIHPRINIRLQYIRNTSEYIPKLHIYQHSLLTRKVFSRRSFSAQVLFSVSSGSSSGLRHLQSHLHLQVIFIYNSSSFSSHLHLDLDHHSIWIITRSGSSSLDLDHHWIWVITGSSYLDLDHHSIWITITVSGSSLLDHHYWIYILTQSGSVP